MLPNNAPKRPRLSLQIKSSPGQNSRSSRTLANIVDPKSPTAFNTLSNVYTTAIERSTPVQSTPLTAINTQQPLEIQTSSSKDLQARIHTPYTAHYPDTPLTAQPMSPMAMEMTFPSSVMTATPPLSAGAVDSSETRVFNFSTSETIIRSPATQPRRRATSGAQPPYSHPRSLHSILRNSPLPPSSVKTPISPRRQSLRLQEKAAKRVGYNNPLTQTITTNTYTKSHIDLLAEEASPFSPSPATDDSEMMLDVTLAYSGDETRDGGQTPGPFEEMRRRMAGLGTETPVSSPGPGGIRKRKRKEKKRRWVWTIGQDEEENESGAIAAIRAAALAQSEATPTVATASAKAVTPEPVTAVQISVESAETNEQETIDRHEVDMSDTSSMLSSSRATTPFSVDSMDLDLKTPTVILSSDGKLTRPTPSRVDRLGSVESFNPETGTRRDTPIPEHLLVN